ncbi:MAG: aconitate hydratase [Verrucomicrobia bacterium]|nr:aconitate hydratase [Verrucomicrobiota bacterium]MCG2680183.1 aconitate hydratase [Kiritimatiellia bacterium]MBU4247501.1 aconitate hydratase [Verrucomicrobiota bacterium]MBU4289470.1 aconitate hydratase [Verrucomicrobiota bacterium]MBU4429635.1 aconitate hydratase [Verrucomicrobiota bacterium]
MNVTQKILSEHLVSGSLTPGEEIAIRIDQTLTQDATGTMACLQFESMGLDRVKNELAVSYVDHNTVQVGFENADDHRYLQSVAARYGIVFSRPGNGICHQLHLERFGVPGKTLLGSDSHTPTGGGLGMLAIGAGGLDVAVAMAGGAFYLTAPRVVRITLKGRLKPWVSAKDIILKVLEVFGTKGNVGCVFEYGGPGIAHLDVPERATIANMGAECGVTTSVFPSDDLTRRFLEAQGRGAAWREILPDADAAYEREVILNLADVEPLAAAPHSPGNVTPVAKLEGMKVDQVLIGSCTNSSYRDLKTVARLLEGRTVHPDVSLGIAPGSRQVLAMLAKDKSLAALVGAGARILENTCGFCIGNSMSPGTEGVSLRTSNRNFEGRSGTPSARVYLVSPEVAAVAAIHGRIRDPRRTDLECPRVSMPKAFEIDDSMFLRPSEDGSGVKIIRGPNIGEPPKNHALPSELAGVVVIKVGDNITTDHIMPAGARLKYRSNIPAYARYVFEPVDPEFAGRAKKFQDEGGHNFIVAGESYGQGSSREHAAICPMFLGVKAVIAKSFERIHEANLVNFGIIPLVFARPADYDKLKAGDRLRLAGIRQAIVEGKPIVLRDETAGADMPLKLTLSQRQAEMILAGGLLNVMKTSKL